MARRCKEYSKQDVRMSRRHARFQVPSFVVVALLPWLSGCAVVAVGDAIVGVGAAAVSVAATTVKVGAKAVGAVVDAVTPDSGETQKK
jgi:hypothetical protein